jgi:glycosyltransferase involved in cell wall biosynthesis
MQILVDTRPCVYGFAGIPHDTRQIIKILAGLREIEVSAHIFSRSVSSFIYSYKSALRYGKIAAESAFIATIEDSREFSDRKKLLFGIKALKQLLKGKFCRDRLFPVSALFNDYLWRVFFSYTLSVEDIDLDRIAFFGSEISHSAAEYLNTLCAGICTLNTDNFDIYLGQPPFPLQVSSKTKLALRWHDSMPITHPDTIHNKVQHNKYFLQNFQLNKDKAFFICNSEYTKNRLREIEPNIKDCSLVSYCAIDVEQQVNIDKNLNEDIIYNYSAQIQYRVKQYYNPYKKFDSDIPYLLAVGTIEPRKNYTTLLSAWADYNLEQKTHIQLVIVGNLGWGLDKVLHEMESYLKNREG